MLKHTSKFQELFSLLDQSLANFVKEVDLQKLQNMATDKWSVKDVLCHLAFRHAYYAQNYQALAQGRKPVIFTSKGGAIRNQKGVDSLKGKSKKALIKILHQSQKSLYTSIVIKEVPAMNYTDRKKYQTEDFLTEISRHLQRHTLQVKKAK